MYLYSQWSWYPKIKFFEIVTWYLLHLVEAGNTYYNCPEKYPHYSSPLSKILLKKHGNLFSGYFSFYSVMKRTPNLANQKSEYI